MRRISNIVVHCSDSDNLAHDDIGVIKRWHTKERGFNDVGYHEFIRSDGNLQLGRPYYKAGAHVKGHNTYSLGICLHGKNIFSKKQMDSLYQSLVNKIDSFDLSIEDIKGHYELDNKKTCPNLDMVEIRKNLKEMVYERSGS